MNELVVVVALVITIVLLGYLAWEVNHDDNN
jgi:hypothetical protein